MSTFENITLEDFKRAAADFSKIAKDLPRDSLENGLKAVNLLYLSIPTDQLTLMLAKGYLEWAHKHYIMADVALAAQE